MTKRRFDVIYWPEGKAEEYTGGGPACNPGKKCPHNCCFCYVPNCPPRRTREEFCGVEIKENFLARLAKDLKRLGKVDEPIFLSFACDPWPYGNSPKIRNSREITVRAVEMIHESGNFVNVLSKGDTYDLVSRLIPGDRLGATVTTYDRPTWEPHAAPACRRMYNLRLAHKAFIFTWASFEPIINTVDALAMLNAAAVSLDLAKFGKANHLNDWAWPPDARARVEAIDLTAFLSKATTICQTNNIAYYVKLETRPHLAPGVPAEWEPDQLKGDKQ